MPQLTENNEVQDGTLIGTVRTNKQGSDCTFPICSVEEWLTLTVEEGEKMALEAMWGSGLIDWWY